MIKNYIYGQWVSSQTNESIMKVVNPATKECLGETPKGCQEDVITTVEAAVRRS